MIGTQARRAVGLACAVALLYCVAVVYALGQTLLAATLLLTLTLAVWTYTSPRTLALRYLFPALAAAVVFVVLPMLYTIGLGFTNLGSSNLLDLPRARQFLLDQTDAGPGPRYDFTLSRGPQGEQVQLQEQDQGRLRFVLQLPSHAMPEQVVVALPVADGFADAGLMGIREAIRQRDVLAALEVVLPDGTHLRQVSLREFAPVLPRYRLNADGSLSEPRSGRVLRPDMRSGFFTDQEGRRVLPGFTVFVGLQHFRRLFTDAAFSQPFLRIFAWTLAFASLTVVFTASLGLLLACLLNWESLRLRGVFRFLLFLPYAVPGFISILIFKGLFNQNLGEVNLVLGHLFGIRPHWFDDPLLAKVMILAVNTWLGFPYMMVICMGLIKSIPADLYEASAVAGAGPLTNFFSITLPLILKPLTPLLISSFAFNFNNFVLIALLTGGRPDYLDTRVPAGTSDILVSYTFRIAFQDSGQQFGLAAAISTVIFLIVAAMALLQVRLSRMSSSVPR